ncbi:hypothetical protein ACFV9C_34755 [Kribbella sp. NPDC059898]|uniref:hypothetical protein n=1 Tax=Kribbella sp. NPDC059898 TaxID=3346995 RepID=UPI00365F5B3C
MINEPASRRMILISTTVGVVLAVAGLIARLSNITVAVVLFLVALGAFTLAGYAALDRLAARRKVS